MDTKYLIKTFKNLKTPFLIEKLKLGVWENIIELLAIKKKIQKAIGKDKILLKKRSMELEVDIETKIELLSILDKK